MKYKLIGNNFYVFPLEQVLENRGITKDLFNVDNIYLWVVVQLVLHVLILTEIL